MNLRKREILQLYQQGTREFRRFNLRGLSFEGKNLSDADFSFADIRGTNFRGANLTGARFCGAKAGVQKRWVVLLLLGVFLLVAISAILSVFTSYMISQIFDSSRIENQVFGWISLIVSIVFWIILFYNRIENVAVAVAVAFAVVSTGAGAGAVAVAFAGAGAVAVAVAGAVAFAGAVAVAVAFAVAFAVAIAVAVAFAVAGSIAVAVAVAGAGAGAAAVVAGAGAGALAGAGAVAVVQTLLSIYVAYRAMKGDEKYALVRNIAIAFAASDGTSFRDANLTDADFTNATLKSTDFRGSNITRTCWKNTIKLDRIRPGKTYLKDTKVRELVKTGEGENINLDRSILQGINLQ
ncbi:MAG: pentapeptide repeat-containing protein, partial [Trichodesmium sp. St18_bin1]|nr:pentapeptide repeat-containing protein [Trichodesmium sp. St18_bin1]